MASLIGPLASGINGCASGTAEIFARGTSTLATVYSDKDNATPVTTHPLDANGGVTRYVTQSVDVLCKDSTGTVVRAFTWEDRAESVEVKNLGFTGTLSNGSSGAGGRTTVDAILSSLFSSYGTLDGKVLFNGVPTRLQDIISTNANVFYNVTQSPYNADATGTNDSTAGIQAAIMAAGVAGGGIVYFPAGTYKVSSAILISTNGITLLGTGPTGSIVKNFGTGTASFTVSGNNCEVHSLGFISNATTGFVAALSGTEPKFYGCAFTTGTGGTMFTGGVATSVTYFGCTFNVSNASTGIISMAGTSSVARLVACLVSLQVASPATFFQTSGIVVWAGTQLSSAAAVGTTNVCANTIVRFLLTGCYIDDNVGSAVTNLFAGGASGAPVIESGCYLGTAVSYAGSSLMATAMGFRDAVSLRTVTAAATYTPDATKVRFHEVESSGAAMAFQTPTGTGLNVVADLEIRFKNTNAAGITPTFSAAYKVGALPAVPQNNALALTFRWSSGTSVWICISNTGAIASYAA